MYKSPFLFHSTHCSRLFYLYFISFLRVLLGTDLGGCRKKAKKKRKKKKKRKETNKKERKKDGFKKSTYVILVQPTRERERRRKIDARTIISASESLKDYRSS